MGSKGSDLTYLFRLTVRFYHAVVKLRLRLQEYALTADASGLYEAILAIETPWIVESVELHQSARAVTVYASCDETAMLKRSQYEQDSPRHYKRKRGWRPWDTCRFEMYALPEAPRLQCLEHKELFVLANWAVHQSWFREHSRYI